MKKIKKFLSVLLSSLMLAGGKFTGNKASAINENKIVYTNDNRKFIYISTENIPAVLKLLRNKIEKESKMRFSKSGNIIYKTLVAGAGAVLGVSSYLGASKIENKTASKVTAASLCTAIVAGTLGIMFLPEIKKSKFDVIDAINSNCGVCTEGIIEVGRKINGYYVCTREDCTGFGDSLISYGIGNLLIELERISKDPEDRKKHNKVVDSWGGKRFDPCYSDLDMGIIIEIEVYNRDKNDVHFNIYRQGSQLLYDKDRNVVYEKDSGNVYKLKDEDLTSEGYFILQGGADHSKYSQYKDVSVFYYKRGSFNFNNLDNDQNDFVSKTREINSWDETLTNELFSNK